MTETAGSGFVVDAAPRPDRHRIARRHRGAERERVRDASRAAVRIVLDDGTRADADLLGYDLFEDTALLQVDPAQLGLRALRLGRARALRVGDPVAVDRQPVRESRVALDRRRLPARPSDRRARRVLPHDRRDPDRRGGQPGQLGRPAARCAGTRRRAWSPRSTPTPRGGVAYAVPIEAVERAYRALAAGRQVRYAWLGVSAATVTPALADRARPARRARCPGARAQPGRRGRARRPAGRHPRRSRSPARPIRATATSSSRWARRPSRASATSTARSARTARATASTLHIVRGGSARWCRCACCPARRASPTAADGGAPCADTGYDCEPTRLPGRNKEDVWRAISADGRGRWPTRS